MKQLVAAALLASVIAAPAHAGTLFTQPWDGTDALFADHQQPPQFKGVNASVYDDFHLDGASNVTGLDFTGGYLFTNHDNAILGFALNLYSDNAGAPGSVISSFYLTNYNETAVGYFGVIDVKHYSLSFAPVALGAGDYWMSVVPEIDTVQWFIGGSTSGAQNAIHIFNGAPTDNHTDIAFDVTGERVTGGVPEPATWALMIGGFGLAGAAFRRRREAATA